ncbi:MAG: hypothetical protein ACREQF_03345 [Candidatus Binataceae bacterium]
MNLKNRMLSAALGLGLLAVPAVAVAGHQDSDRAYPGAYNYLRQQQVVAPRWNYRDRDNDWRWSHRDRDRDDDHDRDHDRDWRGYGRYDRDDYCDTARPNLGVIQYRARLVAARNNARARYIAALRSGRQYAAHQWLEVMRHLDARISYLNRQRASGRRYFDYNGGFPAATGYGLYGGGYNPDLYVNNLASAFQSFAPLFNPGVR